MFSYPPLNEYGKVKVDELIKAIDEGEMVNNIFKVYDILYYEEVFDVSLTEDEKIVYYSKDHRLENFALKIYKNGFGKYHSDRN